MSGAATLTIYFGIFGSASVPVLALSEAHAAHKLFHAGYGVSDRIATQRP